MLKRVFNEDEINQILYDGGLYDVDGNCEFEVIKNEIIKFNKEKSSCEKEIVIKELSSGKLYEATLNDSQWIGQDEYNIMQKWFEVENLEMLTCKYIRVK